MEIDPPQRTMFVSSRRIDATCMHICGNAPHTLVVCLQMPSTDTQLARVGHADAKTGALAWYLSQNRFSAGDPSRLSLMPTVSAPPPLSLAVLATTYDGAELCLFCDGLCQQRGPASFDFKEQAIRISGPFVCAQVFEHALTPAQLKALSAQMLREHLIMA